MLALLWAGRQQLRSVAILGNAAGTTARAVGHYFPDTRIDAVEIDPEVTEVGRELFDMTAPRLHTYTRTRGRGCARTRAGRTRS